MRRAALTSLALCLGAAGLSAVLAGCPDRGISEVNPAQGRVENKNIPVKVNRDVDMLFLVDDSPSMADKQNNLAMNFPKFITTLQSIEGGLPNVHIGVATSDLGTRSAKDGTSAPGIGTLGNGGCSGLGKDGNLQLFGAPVMGGPYINDSADPTDPSGVKRIVNYTGNLTDVFAQMAKAGDKGCGFEQHLEGVKLALDPKNTVNAGFLRDDAYLAIIIIADEDDCSILDAGSATTTGLLTASETTQLGALQSFRCTQFGVLCDDGGDTTALMKQVGAKTECHPNDQSAYLTVVADYATYIKSLKSDPSKVIVAGIIGPTTPFATELRAPPGSQTKIPALAHSCTYNGADGVEVADPAVRIQFFLDQFPNRSTFVPICQSDLSGGLQQIAQLLKSVIGDPCIEGTLADVDPNTAGPQYDCAVSQVQDQGQADQTETVIPSCASNNNTAPCWQLELDMTSCPSTPTHQKLDVMGQDALPANTNIVASCVTTVMNE